MNKYKYLVIGGNPYRGYTGTTTFTSLKIFGKANTEEELKKLVSKAYDECAGLACVINTETQELE